MKFERASTYNFGATKLNRRRVSGATPDKQRVCIDTMLVIYTITTYWETDCEGKIWNSKEYLLSLFKENLI